MTHSIISLGKAFPLDSLQRAAVSPVGSVGASKCLRPFEVATGDPHLCTLAPGKLSSRTAHPAFSVGHFDPLISLRSESGCHLGNLIFNDIEALRKNNVVNLTTLFSGNWEINVLPFSLHGFPAPFRRRFPALPLGGHRRVSHADGHAVFKVQQAKRQQKSRHKTDQPCLRFFWKVMLVGYVTAESQDVQPRRI